MSKTSAANLTVKALNDLYRPLDNRITDEAEELLREQVNELSPERERENFLVRLTIVTVIFSQFETTWYNIFRSQMEALQKLNTRPLKRESLFEYYAHAATMYPKPGLGGQRRR